MGRLRLIHPKWSLDLLPHFCAEFPLAVLLALPMAAQPALFYSDLDSGPNSGGQNNLGAYVTLYGKGFGATQGSSSVKVGSGLVSAYPVWTDGKIVVQLGPQAATGGMVVSTAAGVSSAVPFTVRAGNIYFVAAAGNDGNSGSFASPWATLLHAMSAMSPGDISYAMSGVAQSYDDGSGWDTCMLLDGNSGAPDEPKALVVYPGATATIGSATGCGTAVRSKGNGNHYLTFAGFTVLGKSITFNSYNDHGWRMVGNDLSCPNGNDQAGCLNIGGDSAGGGSHDMSIEGNTIHNVGTNLLPDAVTALYHGVYLSETNHNIDFGWNTVAFVNGGRCVQQNVNEGGGSYSLFIHDNTIHDCQLDGIVMTTVNPSLGTVALYNNVIYNAGKGPGNAENSGAWNCMNIQGWMAWGATGESGIVQVYNNTMYGCGTWSSPPYGESSGGVLWEDGNSTTKGINLVDNIVVLTTGPSAGLPYVTNSGRAEAVTGSNNLFFGNGSTLAAGNSLTNSTFGDPLFVGPPSQDFHIFAGSPAMQGGVATADISDLDGLRLPQGSRYPIGAYASAGNSASPPVFLSLSPSAVSLQAGQAENFSAEVSNAGDAGVVWTLSPSIGTLSKTGTYTAPASVPAAQTVLVRAASIADGSKSAVAQITLVPVSVIATPLTASLRPGQTQQFYAAVTATNNPAVVWSVNPADGSVSPAGLYTASLGSPLTPTVTVSATSLADPTKFSSVSIQLLPPLVAVAISPASASLSAGQSKQFTPTVTGSGNVQVIWSLAPAIGTLSRVGLYSAPASVVTPLTVTVTATSVADDTQSARAIVTLDPASNQTISATITQTSTGWRLSWAAPPGRPSTDWIGLSSVHAPDWWSVWSEYTKGSTSGAFSIPAPVAPGIYELRYYAKNTYTILARSNPVPLAVAGFNTGVSNPVITPGGPLADYWTAAPGRTSSDYVGLYALGATSDDPIWWEPTLGLPLGVSPGWGAPTPPGAYEFRYIAGGGYLCVAIGSPISIH